MGGNNFSNILIRVGVNVRTIGQPHLRPDQNNLPVVENHPGQTSLRRMIDHSIPIPLTDNYIGHSCVVQAYPRPQRYLDNLGGR